MIWPYSSYDAIAELRLVARLPEPTPPLPRRRVERSPVPLVPDKTVGRKAEYG
jgi:hypothetical protein